MIYSFTIYKEEGPLGTTKTLINTEDSDFELLGEVNGVSYAYLPDNITPPQQYNDINFQSTEPTDEVLKQLKLQRFAKTKKIILQDKITDEVGDVYDMMADCMKLIEFNIMLTSRLAADYFGTSPLEGDTRTEYANRNQSFLDQVGSGNILLRGDIENVDLMFERLMLRYSNIQNIVDTEYISELKRVGLINK